MTTKENLPPGVTATEDGGAVVPLSWPIKRDGVSVASLTLRRVKSGDLRRLDSQSGGEGAKTLWLVGRLSGLAPTEVDEIDAIDLAVISAVVEVFTGMARG